MQSRRGGAGFRRQAVVIQGDALNRSALGTVVCIPLTSNTKWAEAPGNVLLPAKTTGLSKDSVANVSQIVTADRATLHDRMGRLPKTKLNAIFAGIDIMLER